MLYACGPPGRVQTGRADCAFRQRLLVLSGEHKAAVPTRVSLLGSIYAACVLATRLALLDGGRDGGHSCPLAQAAEPLEATFR